MKTIGIIGGLGPLATAYYLETIVRFTDVRKDQDHPRVFLESIPDMPDRTAYILDSGKESPLPYILEAGKRLEDCGADFLTIPCISAHYFYEELTKSFRIPVISLTGSTADYIVSQGIKRVGIMATTGAVRGQVLQKELQTRGIESIVPEEKIQRLVMQVVYDQIKKGAPIAWDSVEQIIAHLKEKGAEKIILGCTELPLMKREILTTDRRRLKKALQEDCVDVIEILARKAVAVSGAPVKSHFD